MSENEMNGELVGAPHGAIYVRVSSANQEPPPEGMTALQYQLECVIRYAAKADDEVERTDIDTVDPAPESPDVA